MSRRPLRDWEPEPSNASADRDAPTVRVAHLSDLHIVGERYGYRMESGTLGPAGNRCMRQALDRLCAIHALTPLDRVLVTGDVTDAGTRAEWLELIDLLRGSPEIRSRTLFVPGNHDVNTSTAPTPDASICPGASAMRSAACGSSSRSTTRRRTRSHRG